MALVSPSLLSADFSCLEKQIEMLERCGADYLHFDVMDGHFVDNISFGIPVFDSVKNKTKLVKDVHLMVEDVEKYAHRFVLAGADIVTFHIEALKGEKCEELLDWVHEKGKKVGLSLRPSTPISELFPYLPKLDLVLIMSVEPGFGGQGFLKESLEKITSLKEEIRRQKGKTLIEVDGGIQQETAQWCLQAGADILVSGSYLFRLSEEALKKQINEWKVKK